MLSIAPSVQSPRAYDLENLQASQLLARFTRAALYDKLQPTTLAEEAKGKTPVDRTYPEGHVNRYAINTTPGTTDMAQAFKDAYDVCSSVLALSNWVTCNNNEIYGIGATVECDSTRPVNWWFDMLSPEGGVSGYIKPLDDLPNGIIRYRNAGRNAHGGIIYRIAVYDNAGRNRTVLGALVLDDFGNGRVIEPWIGYIKGHGIRTDNWVFGDIVSPVIRLCGDTGRPGLQLGIAGSSFLTQSVTVTNEKSEVNYETFYTHVTTGAQDIKIIGSQYEAETDIAESCHEFLVVDISTCHVESPGFNRNTTTSFVANASCTFSNMQFNSDTDDGVPKAKLLAAVSGHGIKMIGANTNTGYDLQCGSPGSPSNAVISGIVIAGAGMICYGNGSYSDIRLAGTYAYGGASPTGKYALVLGEAGGAASQAVNVRVDTVQENNHGIHLPVAKSRVDDVIIVGVTGTGHGVKQAADTDVSNISFSGVTNKFANANVDPDSCRISNYSGYRRKGTAQITTGTTTVVVTHTAEFTPTLQQIRVTGASNFYPYVTNITSTQMTINVGVAPGGNIDFGWVVEY